MDSLSSGKAQTAQAIFMAPILLAFLIGSLPVLLPVMIYRWIVDKPQKRAERSNRR